MDQRIDESLGMLYLTAGLASDIIAIETNNPPILVIYYLTTTTSTQ